MPRNAAERAETLSELDGAIRTVKRHIRDLRDHLGVLHRTRAAVTGIEIETVGENTSPAPMSPAQQEAHERTSRQLEQLAGSALEHHDSHVTRTLGGRSATDAQDRSN